MEVKQAGNQYSDEDIRNAVNDKTPLDAIIMVIGLIQRQTIALERIATSLEAPPTVLFEEVVASNRETRFGEFVHGDEPDSDGLGVITGKDDKEH